MTEVYAKGIYMNYVEPKLKRVHLVKIGPSSLHNSLFQSGALSHGAPAVFLFIESENAKKRKRT